MAVVALDPRFARVLELPREVQEHELARRVAHIGGFNEPTRPETAAFLVPFALRIEELLTWEPEPRDVLAMAGAHAVGPEFVGEFDPRDLMVAAIDLDGLEGKLTYPPRHAPMRELVLEYFQHEMMWVLAAKIGRLLILAGYLED